MQRDDFRADIPVSRGQWRALALAALSRMGESTPDTRMDATELLVRFHRAETDAPARAAAAAVANGR